MPDNKDDLLSAYVDGVGELTPDERRRVESALTDPAVRSDETATRELLDQLRSLPPVGNEPDWSALERSIHEAVGPDVPRVWWRRWRFALPALALAATAAIVFVLSQPDTNESPITFELPKPPVPTVVEQQPVYAVYLDGVGMELDFIDDELLDDAFDNLAADEDLAMPDLLAPEDLAWVDELDDADLDHVEHALNRGRG